MNNLSYLKVLNKEQALQILGQEYPDTEFSFVHRAHHNNCDGMTYCFRSPSQHHVYYYVDENDGSVRVQDLRAQKASS